MITNDRIRRNLIEIKGIEDRLQALPPLKNSAPSVRVKIAGTASGDSLYKQTLIARVNELD